jgi:hypothetical protein
VGYYKNRSIGDDSKLSEIISRFEEDHGLPPIDGVSEAQARYGRSMRYQRLPAIERQLREGMRYLLSPRQREFVSDCIYGNRSAHWWIAAKDKTSREIIESIASPLGEPTPPPAKKKADRRSVPKKYAYKGSPKGITPDPSKKAPWED